jgi:hypothetical protein
MKYLATLFLALILLFGLSCDNITEPAEILSTTEQYTRILSRDGFWIYDTTYTDRYIQFEDSLYLGYTKIWRIYYLPTGIYYSRLHIKSIDGEILREFNSHFYQWRVIEENEKWSIEYIAPDNTISLYPIISLDKYEFHRTPGMVYTYISNE